METIIQTPGRSNCPVCGKNLRVTRASVLVVHDEETYCSKACFEHQQYLSFKSRSTSSPFVRRKEESGNIQKARAIEP